MLSSVLQYHRAHIINRVKAYNKTAWNTRYVTARMEVPREKVMRVTSVIESQADGDYGVVPRGKRLRPRVRGTRKETVRARDKTSL